MALGASGVTAVPGQPKFGSCWLVENRYQAVRTFHPEPPTAHHPMVCAQAGASRSLRLRPTLQAVPRTSQGRAEYNRDPYVVASPAGCTAQLDREGWFLVRFVKAVPNEGFGGFEARVFRGDLPDSIANEIRKALALPRLP